MIDERFWSRPLSAIALDLRQRLVPYRLLLGLGSLLAPRVAATARTTIGATLWFFACLVVLVGTTLAWAGSLEGLGLAIVSASATYATALYAIDLLGRNAIRTLRESFDGLPLSARAKHVAFGWMEGVTPARQWAFALGCATIGVVVTALMDPSRTGWLSGSLGVHAPIPVHGSTYVAMALAGFTLGFGVAYAVILPIGLARALELNVGELPFARLDPGRTSFVQAGIRFTNRCASAAAGMVLMCLATLASLRPVWTAPSFVPLLVALVVGAAATTVLFLGPQLIVARLVAREKQSIVLELEDRANRLWSEALEDRSKLDQLTGIQQLLHTIDRTPNTVRVIATLRTYSVWILSQTLATLAGVLPWWELLRR